MPSSSHEAYLTFVGQWSRDHAQEPDVVPMLERYAWAAQVLSVLDLEPAREVLRSCYAVHPRGGKPRDPLLMLRCLLLALLVGQASLNRWVADLRACRVLRVLCGMDEEKGPGVGTLYDMLHRLHDGPIRTCACGGTEAPSDHERRRACQARPPQLPAEPKASGDDSVTEKLVAELEAARHLPNPNDLLARLSSLLLTMAVVPSLQRGLLGDSEAVVACGDGSALVTGASSYGHKICGHGRQKCECDRIWTDGDARVGYDSYRDRYFFGHHSYEWSVTTAGHDLPLAISLEPGNTTDFTAGPACFERLQKDLRSHQVPLRIAVAVADKGHDAKAIYAYFRAQNIETVIPLQKAPASYPERPELKLSERGVPLCEAHMEMAPHGTSRKGHRIFVCPVKAGKQPHCPLAPQETPDWRCRPEGKLTPTVTLSENTQPRLSPSIPRNSERYKTLSKQRSGCERSNATKKETFRLEQARHRRASFWLIRLHLIAILQHARVWVSSQEPLDFIRQLLSAPSPSPAV